LFNFKTMEFQRITRKHKGLFYWECMKVGISDVLSSLSFSPCYTFLQYFIYIYVYIYTFLQYFYFRQSIQAGEIPKQCVEANKSCKASPDEERVGKWCKGGKIRTCLNFGFSEVLAMQMRPAYEVPESSSASSLLHVQLRTVCYSSNF